MPTGASTVLEVAEGVRLEVPHPEGAEELPASALPHVSLPPQARVRVVARAGWTGDSDVLLHVACVRGASDGWAPGVEELVLAHASAQARGITSAELDRWEPSAIQRLGDRFEQRAEGAGHRDGQPVHVRARHLLGFTGSDRDGVLCTVLCREPAPESTCSSLVDATAVRGTFAEAPSPSLPVQAIVLAARHPTAAGATASALVVGLIALILARRPRPRP